MSSLFGGKQTTTQVQRVDPTTEALNKLRLDQLSSVFDASPLAGFTSPRPDLFSLSDVSSKLINDIVSGKSINIDDYVNIGLDQISNYISKIAKPEILSTAVQQGLEGGGFVPEALAKATAQVGLPFIQGIPAAAGLFHNIAQEKVGLSDTSRRLALEDFMRRQGISSSSLAGIPFTPQVTTSQSGRQAGLLENLVSNPLNLLLPAAGVGLATGGFGLFSSGLGSAGVPPLPKPMGF